MRDGAVRGVRLAGSGDVVEAPLVVACDGALSLLAKDGGLHDGFTAEQVGLGVRALYALDEETVNERFGLVGREGATSEFLGCTGGVRGGGFIYTQADALSVGIVVHLDSLKERGIPPYELLDRFTASPQVARQLRGARLVEYSAHLLGEAGVGMTPRLSAAGLLVAGDAAGFCYTNGLITEGMNLAMTSGRSPPRPGPRRWRRATSPRPAWRCTRSSSDAASCCATSRRSAMPSASCTTTGCSRSTRRS